MMSNSDLPNNRSYPLLATPSTKASRSFVITSLDFLPQAFRRLSAWASEYPANFWATRMTDSW